MSTSFFVRSPVLATETGEGRTAVLCDRCGRAKRTQTGQLAVELDSPEHQVWPTSANAVLVSLSVAEDLRAVAGEAVQFDDVTVSWKEGAPWRESPLPRLVQVRPKAAVGAASASIEFEDCGCGAVRRASFNPLVLQALPQLPSLAYVRESPDVIVFDERVRRVFGEAETLLEFGEACLEGDYKPSKNTFEGADWSDLKGT